MQLNLSYRRTTRSSNLVAGAESYFLQNNPNFVTKGRAEKLLSPALENNELSTLKIFTGLCGLPDVF